MKWETGLKYVRFHLKVWLLVILHPVSVSKLPNNENKNLPLLLPFHDQLLASSYIILYFAYFPLEVVVRVEFGI
jgi:hypothetical protein